MSIEPRVTQRIRDLVPLCARRIAHNVEGIENGAGSAQAQQPKTKAVESVECDRSTDTPTRRTDVSLLQDTDNIDPK